MKSAALTILVLSIFEWLFYTGFTVQRVTKRFTGLFVISVTGIQLAKRGSTQSPPPTTEGLWASCWCTISPMLKHLKIFQSGCAT